MAGIYIHIPFCKQACYYCDFHFSTHVSEKSVLVDCLIREIELQRHYLNEPVETIYFGGGTPSLLTSTEINRLLDTVRKNFTVALNPEITLEANPDDLDLIGLQALRQLSINRLSIGIQSFQNDVLKFLNRAHDSSQAIQVVHDARAAGFDNISIDLIYSIPGQPESQWLQNIEQAVRLQPEHISSYSLTIEDKTVFGKWAAKGKLTPEPDETAARQLELLVAELHDHGYRQYEVSNFARPGFESKHNSSYWKRKPYLGIGPSAHSYNKSSRQFNVRNNQQYIKSLQQGHIPAEIEVLTRAENINDYLMTTLRTSWGTDLEYLAHELDYNLLTVHGPYIQQLQKENLAAIEGKNLTLTAKGKMVADQIASDLFFIS